MSNFYDDFMFLQQIVEYWALETPEAVAVISGDFQIGYNSLNVRANQIARELVSNGVKSGDLIGLCVDSSIDLISSQLAILKCGAAYLPLDVSQPAYRIQYILEDAKPKLTVIDNIEKCKIINSRIFDLVESEHKIDQQPVTNVTVDNTNTDLCYVIYTSGTTGKPNGVRVCHSNVINLLKAAAQTYDFTKNDVWTLFHSYAFDFSVWEIWGALAFGGRLVIVPHNISRSPKDFFKFLVKNNVTVLNQTPAAFYQLIDAAKQDKDKDSRALKLRYVIFGGDTLHPHCLYDWFNMFGDENPQLYNMYGITETTVHVTYHRVTMLDLGGNKSIIGKPLPSYKILLLDQNGQEVTKGEVGEMYILGRGVTKGYLNNPELTSKRFINVADNINKETSFMYRSGDLATMTPDGKLEYLGRIDHQIKLRGYRIELGEIESQLNRQSNVKASAVVLKGNKVERKRLVAFVQLNKANGTTETELRQQLKNYLPEYMIPSNIYFIESMPMTSNNKVDRDFLLKKCTSGQK